MTCRKPSGVRNSRGERVFWVDGRPVLPAEQEIVRVVVRVRRSGAARPHRSTAENRLLKSSGSVPIPTDSNVNDGFSVTHIGMVAVP